MDGNRKKEYHEAVTEGLVQALVRSRGMVTLRELLGLCFDADALVKDGARVNNEEGGLMLRGKKEGSTQGEDGRSDIKSTDQSISYQSNQPTHESRGTQTTIPSKKIERCNWKDSEQEDSTGVWDSLHKAIAASSSKLKRGSEALTQPKSTNKSTSKKFNWEGSGYTDPTGTWDALKRAGAFGSSKLERGSKALTQPESTSKRQRVSKKKDFQQVSRGEKSMVVVLKVRAGKTEDQ